ncbi:TPA: hypothetical protein DEP94_03140 [Candidatus Nomurabacteria bacterium]|nr:hypothetical protein [Candidatus Nomurabacteria bacterium]
MKVDSVKPSIEQDRDMSQRATVLEDLYKGYFGSQENCRYFVEHIPQDFLSVSNPKVLDAGSSLGTVGKYVCRELSGQGITPQLILLDTNEEILKKSLDTLYKIVANLKQIPLADSSMNIILLRSVLHYEPTLEAQEAILKEIYRVLAPGGVFISQFGSFKDDDEAQAFNRLFKFLKRDVGFVSKDTGVKMHADVFDEIYKITEGPSLEENVDEFSARVGKDISGEVGDYISGHQSELKNILVNNNPITWRVGFTIVSCRKK